MLRNRRLLLAIVLGALLLPLMATAGDIVTYDKANHKELKGLVPDPVLTWMQNGDWIMRVADLEYDWTDTQPSWVKESRTENVGKYTLSDDVTIVICKCHARGD